MHYARPSDNAIWVYMLDVVSRDMFTATDDPNHEVKSLEKASVAQCKYVKKIRKNSVPKVQGLISVLRLMEE